MAQALASGAEVETPLWRVLGALLVCSGLAVGAAYALRAKMGQPVFSASGNGVMHGLGQLMPKMAERSARPRRLRLVETIRVGAQAEFALVRCDGTEFLVAISPQGVSLLGECAATGEGSSA